MRVLIVHDDGAERSKLERRLRQGGFEVILSATAPHAIDRLRKEPFDAIFCQLRRSKRQAEELLRWVGGNLPSVHVLVATESLEEELAGQCAGVAQVRLVESPLDVERLFSIIQSFGPRRGFFGNTIEIELFDYVQMIAVSGRDKLIEIATVDGRSGLVWFEHGDIVHVQYQRLRGERAFYALVAVNRGMFREILYRPPPLRTVQRSSTHLLMEAARRTDEGTLEQASDASMSAGLIAEAPQPVSVGKSPTKQAPKSKKPWKSDRFVAKAKRPPERKPPSERAPPRSERADLESTSDGVPQQAQEADEASFHDLNDISAALVAGLSDKRRRGEGARSGTLIVEEEENVPQQTHVSGNIDEILKDEAEPRLRVVEGGSEQANEEIEVRNSDVILLDEDFDSDIAIDEIQLEEIEDLGSYHAINAAARGIVESPASTDDMLAQFWQFDHVDGVALLSSTGRIVAEDMRGKEVLLNLAAAYMRGAARVARALGQNVFDGVVARFEGGKQLVLVSMGAAVAVLSVEPDADAEEVRIAVMGDA
jgi:CheY-like chemotaxis protein